MQGNLTCNEVRLIVSQTIHLLKHEYLVEEIGYPPVEELTERIIRDSFPGVLYEAD